MIPILFGTDEQNFASQGLGALSDVISCEVQEEKNGIYELEMEYPITGLHYEEIEKRKIIYAIPSPYRTPQPFRIYKVTKPLSGVITVYAAHLSYDLNGIPINPFDASNLVTALSGLESNAAIENPFSFWTDKSSVAEWSLDIPTACRSCLGGIQGSILDVYGGEYEWDKTVVKLHQERGTDSGVSIRYRKNLTDLSHEEDVENTVTGIYPYWKDSEGNLVTCSPPIIYATRNFDYQKAIPVDFSSDFEEQPTQEQLKSAAESYITRNDIGKPTVSMKVSFIQLEQMTGYEDIALLEKCDLCDTVTVQYEQLGVDVTAKVVKITTNVLTERYESMELGSIRANVAQTIAQQNKDLGNQNSKLTDHQKWLYEQQQQINELPTQSQLESAVENATNLITGNQGGYIILRLNDIGQPYEMLIMNTMNITTAMNVWRFNQNGWGYSRNGYNGPYSLAATINGGIVADFVTAGTMLFNRLKGGTLQLGGSGNGSGVQQIQGAAGNVIGTWDSGGIDILYGTLNIGNNFEVSLSGNLKAYVPRFYSSINLSPTTNLDNNDAVMVMQLTATNHLNIGSGDMEIWTGQKIWASDLTVMGEFVVIGEKSNAVETEEYGTRLLYAAESPMPIYFDSGEGTTDETGVCYVQIDEIFQEAAYTKGSYQVFLTGHEAGVFYVGKRETNYFVVYGPQNAKFDWKIEARQMRSREKRFEKMGQIERYRPKNDERTYYSEAASWQRKTGERDYILQNEYHKRHNQETEYIAEVEAVKKKVKKAEEELL